MECDLSKDTKTTCQTSEATKGQLGNLIFDTWF